MGNEWTVLATLHFNESVFLRGYYDCKKKDTEQDFTNLLHDKVDYGILLTFGA